MKHHTLVMAAAVACLGASAAWADMAGHMMVAPDELKWADVTAVPPGVKMAVIEGPLNEAVPITFRLKLPANYKIPAHWHPGVEHVTVLSGTLNMGIGDKFDAAQTRALPVGSVAIMQPRTNHFAWAKEATVIQVHGIGPWGINYVDPADDPRRK